MVICGNFRPTLTRSALNLMARATNFTIGAVTLTAIAVAFVGFLGFRKIHAVQQRGPLRIVFEGSASGLAKGGSVNFDGVQIGEVTSIKLDGPRKIVALATRGKQCADPQGYRGRAWSSRD